MSWSRAKAEERIERIRSQVDEKPIGVATLNEEYVSTRARKFNIEYTGAGAIPAPVLTGIPLNQPVLVDAVHVYCNLINFPDIDGASPDASEEQHKELIAYLHQHYQSSDLAIGFGGGRRVDFHGQRIHCVIFEPMGDERARVRKALYLAQLIQAFGQYIAQRTNGGKFVPSHRIGIDTGRAIAIESGYGSEKEPLFLGNPANYAAKLAEPNCDAPQPGIFLSDRVRRILGDSDLGSIDLERQSPVSRNLLNEIALEKLMATGGRSELLREDFNLLSRISPEIEKQVSAFEKEVGKSFDQYISPANVRFRELKHPVRGIRFSSLTPSNSLRGNAVSLFADIDGFTNYISSRIETNQIDSAVRNIHVIRGELANVLRDDFDGRKVRFIGDCVHGLITDKSSNGLIDKMASVTAAAACSAAMFSSFDLISSKLSDMDDLGLAVGFELGATPVSRLGLRGDRSVRCATSYSTIFSERAQQACQADQTGIGRRALYAASPAVSDLFKVDKGEFHISGKLTFPVVMAHIADFESIPAQARGTGGDSFQAHLG